MKQMEQVTILKLNPYFIKTLGRDTYISYNNGGFTPA